MSRAASATIHIDALRHNLGVVRRRAPASRVLAVVKADGYGHGLERVAHALEGADGFGVAALADAERLRAAGLSQRIVLLSGFDEPADLPALRRLAVETVVHHDSQLDMLAAERDALPPLRVWLKLDSGMHRLGFAPERAVEVHARLRALPNVDNEIVLMTHFAASDEFASSRTPEQQAAFEHAVDGLPGLRSLANSAAVLGWPATHADWIRPGGALYGLSAVDGKSGVDLGLQPAMTLSTRLVAINRVARGERVGYGGTFACPDDMPIGVAAIGYGDGYPRSAPSGTPVLVNGQRAPIVGRVSMDLLAIDLRALPDARVGDPVVLWGRGLPIEEIAASAGTIGYELACGITRRVRFVED
ncbi:alanine racemase [Chiayiivirga flava]|uniref:Alanine racemase n=1 Tax=Chiayiivirga flava TaxID=659595 RepID=A0A7W8D2D5_9GAMM|nr:alanine racemase [Chiayiivirga flava]MBB5206710.1 alanine racemase [Chiayiivirga flava]